MRDGENMPQNKPTEHFFDGGLHEQPPEFDPQINVGRSPVLMRIMLILINLASFAFCRSFSQSWYGVHGSTPIWIPLVFLAVPLGSLFFIYYYMGRVGYERIMKLICIAFCILGVANIFFPIHSSSVGGDGYSSDYGYVTAAGSAVGLDFPSDGSATTVDGSLAVTESGSRLTLIKAFIKGERLETCTDVIFSEEQATDFEKIIGENPIWLDEIPERLDGLAYSALDRSGYDRILIFNCETDEFNALPESGKHTFYQVMYNLQNHELRILKYTKKF